MRKVYQTLSTTSRVTQNVPGTKAEHGIVVHAVTFLSEESRLLEKTSPNAT